MRNYKSYNELRAINESLDEKIFNLFAINQSSKALLSQLDLDSLYGLAVDVFSELTQSSATGFVLFDEKAKNMSSGHAGSCWKMLNHRISYWRCGTMP